MSNTLNPTAAQTPASNTDAVCTMAAPTDGTRWVLCSVSWTYSAAPTSGKLTIAWGAYQETFHVVLGGPGQLVFPVKKVFPISTAVAITLTAGGSGIFSKVFPVAYTSN